MAVAEMKRLLLLGIASLGVLAAAVPVRSETVLRVVMSPNVTSP